MRQAREQRLSITSVDGHGFKVPQYWYSVDELPLNSAGKVVRGALRSSHASRQRG
jgi:acyl-coenzyme A synthetase/AMP-(fatty) acid ligase